MKNKQWVRLAWVGVLSAMACAAQAEFYAGGGLGMTQATANDREGQLAGRAADDELNGGRGSYELDDVTYNAKLFGGYWFNRHAGVEVQYLMLGDLNDRYEGVRTDLFGRLAREQRDSYTARLYGLTFNGRLATQGKLEVMGKVGLAHWRATSKGQRECSYVGTIDRCTAFTAEQGKKSATGTSVDFGLGLLYPLTPAVVLRGEWERFNKVGDAQTTKTDLNLFSLGVEVRFRPMTSMPAPAWALDTQRLYYGAGLSLNRASNTDPGVGGQLFTGYDALYRVGRLTLGAELGYLNTGNMDFEQPIGNRIATRAAGVWISAIARLPVANRWEFLARAGGDFGDDAGILAGVGVGWEFMERTQARLEYALRDHIDAVQLNMVYRP